MQHITPAPCVAGQGKGSLCIHYDFVGDRGKVIQIKIGGADKGADFFPLRLEIFEGAPQFPKGFTSGPVSGNIEDDPPNSIVLARPFNYPENFQIGMGAERTHPALNRLIVQVKFKIYILRK